GVIVAGAALGRRQIIPAVALEEVRPLDEAERAAGKNVPDRALQRFRAGIPLLQQNTVEGGVFRRPAVAFGAVVPLHVEKPLAALVVMEKRRIEARGIDVDGIGP